VFVSVTQLIGYLSVLRGEVQCGGLSTYDCLLAPRSTAGRLTKLGWVSLGIGSNRSRSGAKVLEPRSPQQQRRNCPPPTYEQAQANWLAPSHETTGMRAASAALEEPNGKVTPLKGVECKPT